MAMIVESDAAQCGTTSGEEDSPMSPVKAGGLDQATNSIMGLSTESQVGRLLGKVMTMFGSIVTGLEHADISHLEDMPSSMRDLWTSSTTSYPSLFKSSHCWRGRPPLVRELILDTLESLQKHGSSTLSQSKCSFRVNYCGEINMSINPDMAIAQLVDPDPAGLTLITGLQSPTVDRFGFAAPYKLSIIVKPFKESNIQVNLTPDFLLLTCISVNLEIHIENVTNCASDYRADGLLTTVGDCQKI